MTKPEPTAADFIQPLNMNGLSGRMLHAPAHSKKHTREILLVYGHHAMLERWWGLVQNLQECGTVTVPDLPGFGGMDSFYAIGRRPTLDNYADYLAAFVKMRYRSRRVTLMGISFGFLVITRMLQKYPELAKKVDLVISVVGFMHRDDFHFPPRTRRFYRGLAWLFALPPVSFFIRYCGLNRFVIKSIYVRLPAGKRRFVAMEPSDFEEMMDFEVLLWQANDVRTHWRTTNEFLDIDNCQKRINLPVFHVASKADHYFDNYVVEQHMRVVYRDYHQAVMDSPAHTPSIIGTKEDLSIMVPPRLRRELRSAAGK
ncbi:MAG TPA: alpha/beta hydrolase [Candidatus Saccharimonadales bacterium]|nr:alpha/beta hydrolase [Candidatus Saccharimonadales bacterium]